MRMNAKNRREREISPRGSEERPCGSFCVVDYFCFVKIPSDSTAREREQTHSNRKSDRYLPDPLQYGGNLSNGKSSRLKYHFDLLNTEEKIISPKEISSFTYHASHPWLAIIDKGLYYAYSDCVYREISND